jgi:hypothetical protein
MKGRVESREKVDFVSVEHPGGAEKLGRASVSIHYRS